MSLGGPKAVFNIDFLFFFTHFFAFESLTSVKSLKLLVIAQSGKTETNNNTTALL